MSGTFGVRTLRRGANRGRRLLVLLMLAAATGVFWGSRCLADETASGSPPASGASASRPTVIWYHGYYRSLESLDNVLASGLVSQVMIIYKHRWDAPTWRQDADLVQAVQKIRTAGVKLIWCRWLWPGYRIEQSRVSDLFDASYYIQEVQGVKAEAAAIGADSAALDIEPYVYSPMKPILKGGNDVLTAQEVEGLRSAITQAVAAAGQVDFILPSGGDSTDHPYTIIARLGKARIAEYTYYSVTHWCNDPKYRYLYQYEIFGAYVNTTRDNPYHPERPYYLVPEIMESLEWSGKQGLFLYADDAHYAPVAQQLYDYAQAHKPPPPSPAAPPPSATEPSVAVNHPPAWQAIGEQTVAEGRACTFTTTANDADGDALSYGAENLPAGATFANGTFWWQPDYTQAGRHTVTFIASDGQAEAAQTVCIVATNTNRPPVWTPAPDVSAPQDALVSFTLSASDPDGDPLSYSCANLPAGASLEAGTFSWRPNWQQLGNHELTFVASDGPAEAACLVVVAVHSQTGDDRPPVVVRTSPAAGSVQAPVNCLVALDVSDAGAGVNAQSVSLRVNGELAYTGDRTQYDGPAGVCTRTGDAKNYRFFYQPAQMFDYDEPVTASVRAQDAAGNLMPEHTYSFRTEMHSFGVPRSVVEETAGTVKGRLATATAPSGLVWVAWDEGTMALRDIYACCLTPAGTVAAGPWRVTNHPADQRNPDLAVDARGRVYVVWQDMRNGNWDVYAGVSDDGRTFTERQVSDLNCPAGQPRLHQIRPRIAVDAAGTAYVVWQDDRNHNQDIYLARSTDGFATLSEAAVAIEPHDQSCPALAIDGAGVAYVVWSDARHGGADLYAAASDRGWANVPLVCGAATKGNAALAAEPSGALHVVWVNSLNGQSDIYYAALPQGLPPRPVAGRDLIDDSTGAAQSWPAVTLGGRAGRVRAFACWQDERNAGATAGDSDVYLVALGEEPRANVLVAGDPAAQLTPALGADADGDPYLVFVDSHDGRQTVRYAAATAIDRTALASRRVTAADGGVVGAEPDRVSRPGDVCVQVPPGALWSDLTLSILQVKNAPLPASASAVVCAYEFSPSSPMEFAAPVTVTIPYQPLAGALASTVYWYNAQTGLHSQTGLSGIEDIALSPTLRAIRFRTTHFSQYVVAQQRAPSVSVAGGGAGASGGGCSLSRSGALRAGRGEFFLPYAVLLLVWGWLRRRDRRTVRE